MTTRCVAVALFAALGCEPDSARRADEAADDVTVQRDQLREAQEQLQADRDDDTSELVTESQDVVEEAGELARAQSEFARRKALRIQVLRAEYAVIATQPMLISTMAKNFAITDASRGEINEKLSLLQRRLDEAANFIQGLHNAGPEIWAERDAAVRGAMRRLEDAREEAWDALRDAPMAERRAS